VRELVLVLLVALPLVAVSFLLAEGSIEVSEATFGIFGHTVCKCISTMYSVKRSIAVVSYHRTV
jgi:hypothetical protein